LKVISVMSNHKYRKKHKKTGPPVETGRPLRLLDMRILNCIYRADTTASNAKTSNYRVTQLLPVFLRTHLNNKLTQLPEAKRINFYADLSSLK
jgi:hypothetical protein